MLGIQVVDVLNYVGSILGKLHLVSFGLSLCPFLLVVSQWLEAVQKKMGIISSPFVFKTSHTACRQFSSTGATFLCPYIISLIITYGLSVSCHLIYIKFSSHRKEKLDVQNRHDQKQ